MSRVAGFVAGGLVALAGIAARCAEKAPVTRDASARIAVGVNPRPVHLVRPPRAPLTPLAQIGRALFFDSTLSASGRLACASCHAPDRAYASPGSAIARNGGRSGNVVGTRAIPSLRYVDRAPVFSIGPDVGDFDAPSARAFVVQQTGAASIRPVKRAGAAIVSPAMTPRGGLFWDGRASTLQTQAISPLLNPAEMANRSIATVAARIRAAYGPRLAELLGAETIAPPDRLVAEAMFAIARFEMEDASFHPYDSKYDAYLEGRATLSASQARGLALFEDSAKGNCAACHLDRPTADGRPPTFTDFEYEALGIPRNRVIAKRSRDADLGLCGPSRRDLSEQSTFCGMFRTPSLRNVATRGAFFHNGVARTLDEVLRFYAFRDTRPELVYPRDRNGVPARFEDLPTRYRKNIDVTDPPFNRKVGDAPALTELEIRDIIAFLKTLSDGYRETTARR